MKETGLFEKVKNAHKRRLLDKKMKERSIFRAILQNVLLSYFTLLLCQIIFIIVNRKMYSGTFDNNEWWMLLKGNLAFATPAVCYMNALYTLLILFPLHCKEGKAMQSIAKWAFILPNTAGVIANLCDCIYVRYTGRRTTWDIFNEFSNDGNIGKVIGIEIMDNLWLLVAGMVLIYALYKLYTPATKKSKERPLIKYYTTHTALLLVIAPLMIIGIRGGAGKSVRPITLSNANAYVSTPGEAALVINTPFSIIRTAGRKPFATKDYFTDEEADTIYTPVRHYRNANANRKNIVVLIVESFGKEYIGAYNHRPDGSLTPFLDSLIIQSRSYTKSYGNGRKSIDGMPSVLSSIPMFVTPFISSSASLNNISSIAGELAKTGYSSAFFHGAPNGSMGFMAYAKACGFDKYYGKNEYETSPLNKGNDDFDGTWAIWDEPFLRYYAECMNSMTEPFVTAMFTASSHHPFNIPAKYKKTFTASGDPFFKCVQYTDYALQQFFNYAKKQAWYENTLFVITADHTNHSIEERYRTPSGEMEVPVIFFSPQGEAPFEPGIDTAMVAQQIDIMPTVLEYVGYDKPFIAFGKSLISTPREDNFAMNYANETYRYYKDNHIILYDGEGDKPLALFNLSNDILMKNNLLNGTDVQEDMIRKLQAIIQQYMSRMTDNRLTIENDTIKQ